MLRQLEHVVTSSIALGRPQGTSSPSADAKVLQPLTGRSQADLLGGVARSLAIPELQLVAKTLGSLAAVHAKATSGKFRLTSRRTLTNAALLLLVGVLLAFPEALSDGEVLHVGGAQLAWFAVTELLADDVVPSMDLLRLWQRRRLYWHQINTQWEAYERWEDSVTSVKDRLAALSFFGRRTPTLKVDRTSGGLQGVGGLHRVRGTPFMLRAEVAACRFPPEIAEHSQRLLSNQVAKADEACCELATIFE
eukprot:TRINITY_DN3505_c0_g1_i4.p1 TRINITY_DN3505_c0_g1~~TRINITY_DN3505_c0_g1_i4.p1  ORF type:complete len:250 (+),score=39.36 TRINITY_DN3505_c0_g1_i4:141-890(+)